MLYHFFIKNYYKFYKLNITFETLFSNDTKL
nr:MAG TPA: hypothetical protein [Caudoviricetes sp.]